MAWTAPFGRRHRAIGGTLAGMRGSVGDTIVVESERVDAPPRRGVIEEVVRDEPPCYRVRWEDGHESVFTPSAGAARIVQEQRDKSRA